MPSIVQNPSQASTCSPGRPVSAQASRARNRQGNGTAFGVAKKAKGSVHMALTALAARPAYGVTLALADPIAHRWHLRGVQQLPLFGLEADTTDRVLSSHLPGIGRLMGVAWHALTPPEVFEDTYGAHDLTDMLDQHRTVVDEDSPWLAHAVTASCLDCEDLWRDMNRPPDQVLRDLLRDFFTVLAARHRGNLPWKPFFHEESGTRAERRLLRISSCGVAPDYRRCFGGECGSS